MSNKILRVVLILGFALLIGVNFVNGPNLSQSVMASGNQTFALVFSSDPQYPWYNGILPKGLKSESDKKKNSERQITQQYQGMNALALERKNSGFPLIGCIINGDLTAFGHDWQFDKYKQFSKLLTLNQYPGLGNHDYGRNVNDSYENNCATRMVKYMYDWIKSFPTKTGLNLNYDFTDTKYYKGQLRTDYVGSLSYSFNLGKVHIVQLHSYPSYERKWNGWNDGKARRDFIFIKNSFDWLKNDLATARNNGDIIIVNMHNYDDELYKGTDKTTFDTIVKDYGVSAVFAGHYHWDCGKMGNIPGSSIPYFRSGSSSYQDYLVADFDTVNKVMTVKKRFCGENSTTYSFDGTNTWTVTLNDTKPATPLPVPPKKGFVTFFNDGGFVAKFELHYTENGQETVKKTGNMNLGNKKTYDIPPYATDIRVKGEEHTGFKWKTVFDKTYDSSPNACFKLYGTTLIPKWKKE